MTNATYLKLTALTKGEWRIENAILTGENHGEAYSAVDFDADPTDNIAALESVVDVVLRWHDDITKSEARSIALHVVTEWIDDHRNG